MLRVVSGLCSILCKFQSPVVLRVMNWSSQARELKIAYTISWVNICNVATCKSNLIWWYENWLWGWQDACEGHLNWLRVMSGVRLRCYQCKKRLFTAIELCTFCVMSHLQSYWTCNVSKGTTKTKYTCCCLAVSGAGPQKIKTAHKLKAQTSKIVSSFKGPTMSCSLVREYSGHKDGIWEVTAARVGQPVIGTAAAGTVRGSELSWFGGVAAYVATPPNQPQRCILTDYFNNYNFSKLK